MYSLISAMNSFKIVVLICERPLVTERVASSVNYGAWESTDPKK